MREREGGRGEHALSHARLTMQLALANRRELRKNTNVLRGPVLRNRSVYIDIYVRLYIALPKRTCAGAT